jgi:hypothetical protein
MALSRNRECGASRQIAANPFVKGPKRETPRGATLGASR